MKEPLTFSISFTKAREEFGDETLCPEEEDLQFVEKSAYDEAQAEIAELESKLAELYELNTKISVDKKIASAKEEELESKLRFAAGYISATKGWTDRHPEEVLDWLNEVYEENK